MEGEVGVPAWQRGHGLGSPLGRKGQAAQLMRFEMHLGILALPNISFGVTQAACPQGLPVPCPRVPYP